LLRQHEFPEEAEINIGKIFLLGNRIWQKMKHG
jgi:hypothetical protein